MPVMNDYEATAAIRSFLGAWKKNGRKQREDLYDRNQIHISKQTQSDSRFGFIAVLTVLLLIRL